MVVCIYIYYLYFIIALCESPANEGNLDPGMADSTTKNENYSMEEKFHIVNTLNDNC